MNDSNQEYIVSIPHKNELRCIICEVDFVKIRDLPIKSNYHWQILKCRMIIQIIQEVIASPILGTPGLIYVIAAKEFIESSKLKMDLKHLDILYVESQEVSIDVYVKCLNYTIQCKIAPLWNKVGQYYVHEIKFYIITKEFDALKKKILDKNTQLYFCPMKIKIPFIQLEDLGLLDSLIKEFQADDNGIIDLNKYCQSVYILPSMRTAKLVSISKKIPSKCPFANYDELRKYWIDMNGYYLPTTEDGIIYYEVKFHLSETNSFIYPSVCVIKGPIQYIPCKDANNIIPQFINDLYNTLNKVCDKQLYIYNNNREIDHQFKSLDEQNISKVNIHNHNYLLLTRNKELIHNNVINNMIDNMDNMIDKDFNQQLEPTTGYGYNSLINFSKSNKTTTSLNVKKSNDRENYDYNLEISKQVMKFKRNKPSLNTSLTIKNEILNDENEVQTINENTSAFFKEINLLLDQKMFYRSQIKDSTFANATLKQKLSNAMSTTKFERIIDIETLAKDNKLGEVSNVILSNWLYKHLIPHNKQAKKADLIEKVLAQIRSMKKNI
ncbi:myb-like protein D isoform X3 [Vespula squamosa]|uniref:Myb-like protein D isoform X3 n=1 Tax=Vespula squamosa TaxID=30214 RepID=A0ABD2AIG5_VESSQ